MNVLMYSSGHEYIHRLTHELEQKGISVILPKTNYYLFPLNLVRLFLYRSQCDIIHLHWLHVFPAAFLMKLFVLLAKKLGYRLVWTVHNILPHEPKKNDVFHRQWLYHQVDGVFLHYQSNVSRFESDLGVSSEKVCVIFHPTFDASYPNTMSQMQARKRLGIPAGKKVLLCFGQIRPYKGLDLFVEVMHQLGEEYYGIIAGYGADQSVVADLEHNKGSNVHLVPRFIADDEVQVYLNACDVLVAPYKRITTSGVVLLAYAFEKPVITTRLGGLPEVVEEGITGFLTEPGSVADLKEKTLLLFRKDYKKMGQEAKKWSKRFSWEQLAEMTEKEYEEVIKY